MLDPVRTVAPTVAAVSLNEAKMQLHVDHSDDDERITVLVAAATEHVQKLLGRALLAQTWRQDFDGFDDVMRLPIGKVISITSITYYDADNATQTLASTVYAHAQDELGPYVYLKPDQEWPSTYERADAVRVTWVAGDGTTAAAVPANDKAAIIQVLKDLYDAPENDANARSALSLMGASRRMTC
jgi:uncharacterized phiE125 gp8 family phage protein